MTSLFDVLFFNVLFAWLVNDMCIYYFASLLWSLYHVLFVAGWPGFPGIPLPLPLLQVISKRWWTRIYGGYLQFVEVISIYTATWATYKRHLLLQLSATYNWRCTARVIAPLSPFGSKLFLQRQLICSREHAQMASWRTPCTVLQASTQHVGPEWRGCCSDLHAEQQDFASV